MKLNNKGFAITGILYTVFVLFLMILLSVLSGLNIKRQSLEKNMENIKENLEEECEEYTEADKIEVITSGTEKGYTTKYQGKYTLEIGGKEYETYLKKGQQLNSTTLKTLIYIGIDNNYNPTDYSNTYITKICTTEQ